MKKLKAVAVADLSLRFVEKVSDNEFNRYRVAMPRLRMEGYDTDSVKKILEDHLREEIQIEPVQISRSDRLSMDDITELVNKDKIEIVKHILNKNVINSTLYQDIEVSTKTNKFVDFIYKTIHPYIYKQIIKKGSVLLINPIPRFILKKIQKRLSIELRSLHPCLYVTVRAEREDLAKAANRIADLVFRFRNSIKASLTNGIKTIQLADTVGDGKERFGVFAMFHMDNEVAELIKGASEEEKKKKDLILFTEEGDLGIYISDNNPEYYKYNEIKIGANK